MMGRSGLLAAVLCLVVMPVVNAAEPLPPQVLGLVATRQPTPLVCDGNSCSGVLSAFCMQEKRPRPTAGQQYDLAGSGELTMRVTRADGEVVRFSATGMLAFASEGEYTSVRVTMPQNRLAALDATEVAVLVPRHTALVPRMEMDDALREGDMETATGPARLAAEGFFERSTQRTDAVLVMNRLLNLMPVNAAAPARGMEPAWRNVMDQVDGLQLSPVGVRDARDVYERCSHYVERGYSVRMHGCIRKQHDQLLRSINREYWDGTPGY